VIRNLLCGFAVVASLGLTGCGRPEGAEEALAADPASDATTDSKELAGSKCSASAPLVHQLTSRRTFRARAFRRVTRGYFSTLRCQSTTVIGAFSALWRLWAL